MARAEPHEEETLVRLGHSLIDDDGKRYFELPCRHFTNGQCSIYDQRFTKCRTFTCKLLKAYQAGEICVEEASEKVRTAVKLRDAAAAENPAAAVLTGRIRLRREGDSAKERRKLLLNMAALDYYLDVHFRNKDPQIVRGDEATDRN